ncbi:MAG: cation:proton antiporter [Actinomycetota bacterium]|nr:cation:proton antiporter [Actinomycetota bacterium]
MILAVGAPPLVADLGIVLLATAIFGYVAVRLKLVAIVGYLIAGAIIGPLALGWIDDIHLVEQMGEIGIIFLMFFIGLELSGERLRKLGSMMLGGGAVQVGLTIALVMGILFIFGVDARTGIFTGCLVALSSTAVVLKMLEARGHTESETGQTSIALLIFQDIAIVFMVLLVPMLGDQGGSVGEILLELVKAVLLMVVVIILVKAVVPRILDRSAAIENNEVYLLMILAAAGGVAYLVTLLGLTTSLGAFVAGLVVSAGSHREVATRAILPFQAVFAAIFFASVGMRLDVGFVFENLLLVLGIAFAVIVVKIVSIGVAVRLFGQVSAVVVATSILLSQVGEFSLILVQVGEDAGLSPAGVGTDGRQVFIATAVLLIALTPVLYNLAIKAGTNVYYRSADPEAETTATAD